MPEIRIKNKLSLALFMLGIGTNNVNPALAPDHFAFLTNFLGGRSNFHKKLR